MSEWIVGEDVEIEPLYRPVDVAILYGLGQKDRAQHIARQMHYHTVVTTDGEISDSELQRVREKINALRG